MGNFEIEEINTILALVKVTEDDWSHDKKYCATAANGIKYFLRVIRINIQQSIR